jgi:hypothetical protein
LSLKETAHLGLKPQAGMADAKFEETAGWRAGNLLIPLPLNIIRRKT